MSTNFNFPVIGADDELFRQLILENLEQKKKQQKSAIVQSDNRRQAVRYDITIPIVCFPMAKSLEVDPGAQFEGIIVDVSTRGLGLRVACGHVCVGDHLVIAVDSDTESWKFVDVTVLHAEEGGPNSTRLHTTLDGPLRQLFVDDIVLPAFDSDNFQYTHAYPDNIFTSLCAIGAATPVLLDELLVCPDCLSIPTVRHGCSVCLSNETEKSRMIHHFACANVDFVDRFDKDGEIVCLKCRGRKMIIGADYEYLDGPIQCRECGHNDLQEILIGHCMRCSNRFPFENAFRLEVTGYRVNRLDPLALIHRN